MRRNMKGRKIGYAIVGLILVAVLVVGAVFGIMHLQKDKETSAIMKLETNPSVQLVLNKNDKVIAEVALNEDGEKLLATTSFIGLKAEVAGEKFAQTVSEKDKMNDSTTSSPATGRATKVKVTISAENAEEYAELAEKVKTNINTYFSENGVFAGAITEVNNEVVEPMIEAEPAVVEPVQNNETINSFNTVPMANEVENVVVSDTNTNDTIPLTNEIDSSKRVCKNCGNELPSIVSICPNCGTDNE